MVISLKDSDFVLVVSEDLQPTIKVMLATNDSDITDEAIGGNRTTANLVRDMCCAIRALIEQNDDLKHKLFESNRDVDSLKVSLKDAEGARKELEEQAKFLEPRLESMDGDLQRLQDECDTVRYNKERIEEENKELRDLCQKLQTQVAPAQPEYEYMVARTYRGGKNNELVHAFSQGYEFCRASEFIPDCESYYGFIEYILRKKRSEKHEKN